MPEVQRFRAYDDDGRYVTIVELELGPVGRRAFCTASGMAVKPLPLTRACKEFMAPIGSPPRWKCVAPGKATKKKTGPKPPMKGRGRNAHPCQSGVDELC
jgi:hypothetical protein